MRREYRQPGMTLVELLVALVIAAIVCTGVVAVLFATLRADAFVRSQTDALTQADTTLRRIALQLRTASSVPDPASATSFTFVAEPDAATGNRYTISYQLVQTTINGKAMWALQETTNAYTYPDMGTPYNVITNLKPNTGFQVSAVAGSSPKVLQFDITLNTAPTIERKFQVCCRNVE